MVEKEVAVLIVLVRRHRCAVGAVVRRAVDDEVPGAVEEEANQAAVCRVPPGLLGALPVHALGALGTPQKICFAETNGDEKDLDAMADQRSYDVCVSTPNKSKTKNWTAPSTRALEIVPQSSTLP